jgi:hypothetical protein
MTQRDRAAAFRRLHEPRHGAILVLPNAWDAMSAAIIVQAGARAIATTSAGVSWALGRTDGQGLTREEMTEASPSPTPTDFLRERPSTRGLSGPRYRRVKLRLTPIRGVP